MVVSLLLSILLAHLISIHLAQSELIRAKELDVRAQNLVLSALVIWSSQYGWDSGESEGGHLVDLLQVGFEQEIILDDGTVRIQVEEILGEEEVLVSVLAHVNQSEVIRRVRVGIELSSGSILSWSNL